VTTRRTTAPLGLAVSLAEAKETLRIESADTSLDATIILWLKAITREAEHKTQRSFVSQGWRVTLDAFPAAIKLDYAPIISVQSVKYYDENNVQQTLSPLDYFLDSVSEPSYIVPSPGATWPATFSKINSVEVDYTAGYGVDETNVPETAQNYILAKLSVQFDPAVAGSVTTVAQPFTVSYLDRLLDEIRIY